MPVSPLPAVGCGAAASGVAVVVAVVAAVASDGPERPVDVDDAAPFAVVVVAPKPVAVVFAVVGPGVATATAKAAPVVVGSAASPCGFTLVASPVLFAAVPMAVAAGAAGPPLVGRDGGASAAAVEELAAMAAAAIASGAVEFGAVVAPALVFAGCVPTGMAVATAIRVAAGVAVTSACVAPVASVAGAESAEGLSVDLPSPGFEVADFAPPGGLPLPPDFPATGLVGAGVPESPVDVVDVVPGPELPELDNAGLLGGVEASLVVVRCGAGGSGAGMLAGSAGKVLSTSAAKLLPVGDGSGRAGLGGAA